MLAAIRGLCQDVLLLVDLEARLLIEGILGLSRRLSPQFLPAVCAALTNIDVACCAMKMGLGLLLPATPAVIAAKGGIEVPGRRGGPQDACMVVVATWARLGCRRSNPSTVFLELAGRFNRRCAGFICIRGSSAVRCAVATSDLLIEKSTLDCSRRQIPRSRSRVFISLIRGARRSRDSPWRRGGQWRSSQDGACDFARIRDDEQSQLIGCVGCMQELIIKLLGGSARHFTTRGIVQGDMRKGCLCALAGGLALEYPARRHGQLDELRRALPLACCHVGRAGHRCGAHLKCNSQGSVSALPNGSHLNGIRGRGATGQAEHLRALHHGEQTKRSQRQ